MSSKTGINYARRFIVYLTFLFITAISVTACGGGSGGDGSDAGPGVAQTPVTPDTPTSGTEPETETALIPRIPRNNQGMPVGIPAPTFGLQEAHTMYTDQIYQAGGFNYDDAGYGPYSHYIDNTSPGCTDSANPYGTALAPRCSVPLSLAEGSVVEIHGGPYGSLRITGMYGSAEKPIFIRGYDATNRVVINQSPGISINNTSYVIVENIKTDGSSLSNVAPNAGLVITQPSDHIAIRNVESTNYPSPDYCPDRAGGVGCWFGTIWNIGANSRWQPGELIQDIVLYNNHVHHNGDFPPTYETGMHAVNVNGATKNIWILNNDFQYNAEDGIQIYWVNDGTRGQPAEHVYIGHNIIGTNGENAIDVKQSYDVVISQNVLFGYRPTNFIGASGSDGAAVVLNDDKPSDRLWVINNLIFDSTTGIRSQAEANAYIIGNSIYDIHREPQQSAPTSAGRSAGVAIWASSYKSFHVINNSIYDVDGGFYTPFASRPGGVPVVQNNLIANLLETDGVAQYHINLHDPNLPVYTISHNLLYQPSGVIKTRGGCVDCIDNLDPLLIQPESGRLDVSDNSPVYNAGTDADAYVIFEGLYNIDIRSDLDNTIRPVDALIDIGAFEINPQAN